MDVRCSSCGAIMESGSSECPACHSSNSGVARSTPGTAVSTSSEERTWLLAAHLSALAGCVIPFGNMIGPLVVWLMKKNESPAIANAAKDALNFNISMSIYMVGATILSFVGIGLLLMIPLGLGWIIMVVMAAVKTSNNEPFKYPLSLNLVK